MTRNGLMWWSNFNEIFLVSYICCSNLISRSSTNTIYLYLKKKTKKQKNPESSCQLKIFKFFSYQIYIYIKGSGVSAFYHINPLATHVTHWKSHEPILWSIAFKIPHTNKPPIWIPVVIFSYHFGFIKITYPNFLNKLPILKHQLVSFDSFEAINFHARPKCNH